MEIEIFADGGARGNPGPAAAGFLLRRKSDHKVLEARGEFVGEVLTNNQAEYQAVIRALQAAQRYSPEQVTVFLDAKLLVEQLSGRYKVKNQTLKNFFKKVQRLSRNFPVVEFKYIPRKENWAADCLVNKALDEHET